MTTQDRTGPLFFVKVSPRGRAGEQSERIDVTTHVTSFTYEDDEKKADKLVLEIDCYTLEEIDSGRWIEGQTVEVSWGYPENMAPVRSCVIKKVSASRRTIKIESHDQAVLMDRDQKSRTFDNMKRSDVVKAIAEENGFGAERQFIQDTEIVLDTITQGRLSDAQFLRHLANREGFEYFVDFDGIHWHERKLGQRPIREFTYFTDRVGDILDWTIEGDLTNRASTVKSHGRNPITKEDVGGEASNATETGRDTLGSTVITMDRQTGAISINPAAENTRHDEIHSTSETTDEAAQREASGRFKRSSANSFKLKLSLVGDPGIVAKSVIHVRGISERFSGRYYVSNAKHSLSGGYRLALVCKRDAASRGTGIAGEAGKTTGKQNAQDASNAAGDELTIRVDQRSGALRFEQPRGRE